MSDNTDIIQRKQHYRKEFMERVYHANEHKVTEFINQANRWWPGTVRTKIEEEALNEANSNN